MMSRIIQGFGLALAIIAVATLALLLAENGACPRWNLEVVGCMLRTRETLAAGLIAAGGALFAGWLAWRSSRDQVELMRELATRDEREAARVLNDALTPLLDLLDVVLRISREVRAFEGTEEEKLSYTTMLRNGLAGHVPNETILEEIERLGRGLRPIPRYRFADVMENLRWLYRFIGQLRSERVRADELGWRDHEFTMIRGQISVLKRALQRFDPALAARLQHPMPEIPEPRSWAEQFAAYGAMMQTEMADRRERNLEQ